MLVILSPWSSSKLNLIPINKHFYICFDFSKIFVFLYISSNNTFTVSMTYKRLIKRIEFFVRLWTSGQVPGTLNQSYKRQWDIAVWQLPGVNAHWQDCRATATTVVQSSNPLYDVSRVIRVVQTLGTLVIHFLNLGSSGWFIRGYLGYTPRQPHRLSTDRAAFLDAPLLA